ncbi:MAG: ROK family protein [Cyclobacteriaceae bacterium]|nr:ROK family protein [Cyclobacteriaceae bacterium]
MKHADTIWGIDLGGTKAEGVILGPGGPDDVRFRERIPTGAEKGYDHLLAQIEKLVLRMEQVAGYRPARIGMGTPGTLDPQTKTMRGCNSECLNGQPLRDDLSRRLGMAVEIANDANCFALAEANLGVVPRQFPGAQVVFGVIMGTGVGGGLVVNGRSIYGHHGIAGEWGHNFLDESGGPCYCGKSGCVERVLSGPALERYHAARSGEKLRLPEIRQRALSGDPVAKETIARMVDYFGKAISVVINIVDPDVIVLGGGVSQMPELYTDGRLAISKYIFNNGKVSVPLVPALLGDSAGVFGAAYLVKGT